ncbi:MAG: YoaK family protein [Vibrio gallaecicus]
MVSKLPRWIEYGALLLAGLAGCVNAIGLLGFQHQAISHISGTMSLLGSSLLSPSAISLHLLFVIISFMMGAAFSGYFIENQALKLGRRYGVALCIEGSLLFIALWALLNGNIYGQYFASAACGLQNAMITTYSGAIIRTTHMSGIITDLGIMLGAYLKGVPFDRRKAKLLIFIITGFVCGGLMGACLFQSFQIMALAFPASFAFVIALCYWIYLTVIGRKPA